MRRKWVYDPATKEMVEVTPGQAAGVDAPAVWGNFTPVTIPGEQAPITDRGALRRYLKQKDLVPYEDARGVAERARAEKARVEASERKRALVDAYEHRRNQERAKSRYG